MNREDIIEILDWHPGQVDYGESGLLSRIERVVAVAVNAEREACAKVAEAYEPRCDTCPSGVANAIRARGQAQFNRNAPSELHGY
jgi:hypothetical protein